MKKLFIIIFFISNYLFAFENIKPFNGVYFLTGGKEYQVKWQASFKYKLWFPYTGRWYFGYNQVSQWDVYDRSSPFRETNYNPSIFWEYENLFNGFDYLRLGLWEHISNGKDKQDSRGYDKCFAELQFSKGNFLNIGLRLKVWYYYGISFHNQDIGKYVGNTEGEVFLKLRNSAKYVDHERIYIKGGIGGHYFGNEMFSTKIYVGKPEKGWFELGFNFRMITENIQPNFYIQWYRGRNEFLINYYKKTNALRAGFIFNN
jgi:phospholipase A1